MLGALAAEISELLPDLDSGTGAGPPLEDLARRLLAAQRAEIDGIAAFWGAEAPPLDAPWWRHAVPTGLFRRRLLFPASAGEPARVFESSGTTDPARRSRAAFSQKGLELMDVAIDLGAARMLFPEGRGKTRVLVLAPPPELAPAMIMAYGMSRLVEHFGAEGSRFLIGREGLDLRVVLQELQDASDRGVAVTLIGASFGLVHLLDELAGQEGEIPLPAGSRVMHAGGFKGRSRTLEKSVLHRAIAARLGVPEARCVNLLGMTELASQCYDDTLQADFAGRTPTGIKRSAPWTRTVALDPSTLEPSPPGELGVLAHLDLANVERPAAIRTRDVGYVREAGFEILGRATGAEARGCSLSIEELLR